MVHFIALLKAAKNGDGILFRRLVDDHLLEAPLQRRILLDVLTVLVQRGRPYAVKLTAREGRFKHVACVHSTVGLARANQGVQLIYKEDDAPLFFRQFVEHRF